MHLTCEAVRRWHALHSGKVAKIVHGQSLMLVIRIMKLFASSSGRDLLHRNTVSNMFEVRAFELLQKVKLIMATLISVSAMVEHVALDYKETICDLPLLEASVTAFDT